MINLKNSKNEFSDTDKKILDMVIPAIITRLYQEGKIKKESVTRSELLQIMQSYNLDDFSNLKWALVIDDMFEDSVLSEQKNNRNETAIVLAAIAIEQKLNSLYIYILENKYKYSRIKIDKILRKLSFEDKITWFFEITIGKQMDKDIICKTKTLIKSRNYFVHYKPLEANNIDDLPDYEKYIIEFDLIELIHNFEKIYNDTVEYLCPEIKKGKELYNTVYKNI